MNLRFQRRLAAQILKCGENRVWMDPTHIEEIAEAITKEDIRELIREGYIKKMQVKGTSRVRARYIAAQKAKGRRRGHGKRKGAKYARYPRKRRWMKNIRAIRRTLRELRDEGKLDRHHYRKAYRWAKGGIFKSKKHLIQHLEMMGYIEKEGS